MALLVLFYVCSGISYLRTQSVTSDENGFYLYAKRWARGHPGRVDPATDDSKTPIVALNLVPRAMDQALHPGLHKTDNGVSDLLTARYVTLFFSLLTLMIVFSWSRDLFGEKAAVFSVYLLVLEPNFLAVNALVTTDGYSAFFLLAACYALWKLLRAPGWRPLLWFSLAVAATQLVKQSLLHLYILFPMVIGAWLYFHRGTKPSTLVRAFCLFIFIQWLVINLGYYFSGFNTRLGDYHFLSGLFRGLQHHLPPGLVLPLPAPYVQAFDMTKYYDELGGGIAGKSGFGNVTILGRSAQGHGYWYYYFVSLFFKAPVTMMILFCQAIFLTLKHNTVGRSSLICLLGPAVYFLIFFSFFYQVQIGVRHIVFLVPLLCIFLGSVATWSGRWTTRIAVPILSVYLLASYLWYWQHQYSYTNEFVGNKTLAYRLVGSANIDFRQGRYWGDRYLQTHPDVHWAEGNARPGRFLIPVQEYMDIYNEHKLDWLTCHVPYGHVGFSNLLVEVRPEALKHR